MIVDAHVSLDDSRYPVERALAVLARSKIQMAIVFADARVADIDAQNRSVLEAAQAHDLFPFY